MCALFFCMKNGIYTPRFVLLSTSSLFFFMSFFMIIPELPAYLDSMGGEKFKGFIISLFALSAGLSRPFSGKLSDVIGRKPVMVIGGVICVVLGLLYPVVATVYGFLFLRFVHGFSAGFNPTGAVAYLADIVPPNRRGEAIGIFGLVNSVGTSLGPAIGGALANTYGVNTMFVMSGLTGLVSTCMLYAVKETLPVTRKFRPSDLLISFRDIYDNRVKMPAIIMILTVFCFGAVLTLIPDFAASIGIKNKGLFFTVMTVSSIFIRFLTGRLSDKFGRRAVLLMGTFILVVAMFMLAGSHGKFMFIFSAIVFGLATGTNSPTLFAWAIDLSDPKNIGRGTATLFIALEFGIVLGSLIPMTFYNNVPANLPLAFYICALVALVPFSILLVQLVINLQGQRAGGARKAAKPQRNL